MTGPIRKEIGTARPISRRVIKGTIRALIKTKGLRRRTILVLATVFVGGFLLAPGCLHLDWTIFYSTAVAVGLILRSAFFKLF